MEICCLSQNSPDVSLIYLDQNCGFQLLFNNNGHEIEMQSRRFGVEFLSEIIKEV
jgi:hypothetical protein